MNLSEHKNENFIRTEKMRMTDYFFCGGLFTSLDILVFKIPKYGGMT